MNQDLTVAQIEKVNQDLSKAKATRSDATLLTLEQVDQPITTGTCIFCLDENLLQCFHVFCRNCCNQLLVDREPESQEIVLQCSSCQSSEPYPPGVVSQSESELNHRNLACLVQYDDVSCELLSVITRKKTTCRVRKTGLCLYEVSYQPNTRGEHQLTVKVDGNHVTGTCSPITVVKGERGRGGRRRVRERERGDHELSSSLVYF